MRKAAVKDLVTIPSVWADDPKEFPLLHDLRERSNKWAKDPVEIQVSSNEPNEVFVEVEKAALKFENRNIARSARVVLDARDGKDVKIKRLPQALEAISAFMKRDPIDGWIYEEFTDEKGEKFYVPALVTHVSYDPGEPSRGSAPRVMVTLNQVDLTATNSMADTKSLNMRGGSIGLTGTDATNKTAAEALLLKGYVHETAALRAAYDEYMKVYQERVVSGFGKQYVADTITTVDRRTYHSSTDNNVRVVQDTRISVGIDLDDVYTEGPDEEPHKVPVAPLLSVFDLRKHGFSNVYSMALAEYKYRPGITDQLVLPVEHRDLLDVLTTDLDVFSSDIVEGKSAGNVILAKGVPGVGKTLTAEVYAEIVQRPLYSVHSGELGTNAEGIREALEEIFKRAKRWNAVMLLDEADVFVRERGNDIQHNAIVAEFLRTLEYFDGLLFMTTNRDDSIDEAIVSRCAAIISYAKPDRADAIKIWRVLAKVQEVDLPKGMEDTLQGHLPTAAPRDIKMVLRLAARVAKFHKEPLAVDHFRQASMFRGVTWVVNPESDDAV